MGLFDDYEVRNGNCGSWWLARSLDGSRLLLVYTRGAVDHDGALADHNVVHYAGNLRTYASGFRCRVFSLDTAHSVAERPLEEMVDDILFITVALLLLSLETCCWILVCYVHLSGEKTADGKQLLTWEAILFSLG